MFVLIEFVKSFAIINPKRGQEKAQIKKIRQSSKTFPQLTFDVRLTRCLGGGKVSQLLVELDQIGEIVLVLITDGPE